MKRREFTRAAALILPAVGWMAGARAQGGPVAGKDYAVLDKPAPIEAPKGKIEVVEFFSYTCVHCMNFDPTFHAWKKAQPADVVVRMEHVGFQSSFEPFQRLFYALEATGQLEALHGKAFVAIQKEHIRLDKEDVLLDWVAKQGVDRAKFAAAYKSFGVATRVRRAVQLQEAFRVEGTPALGIAGRYYTDGSMARGFDGMIRVADTLIAQERKRG